MARKRITTEQIIGYLRQAEVMIGRGCTIEEVMREIDVTANTYDRWRKELETENAQQKLGVETPYIEPSSPWESSYNESFNGRPHEGRSLRYGKKTHLNRELNNGG